MDLMEKTVRDLDENYLKDEIKRKKTKLRRLNERRKREARQLIIKRKTSKNRKTLLARESVSKIISCDIIINS
jgi:hypothetical protein